MGLPLTWDQMPLTTSEQAAVQALIDWKTAGGGDAPPLTYSEVKTIRAWVSSAGALVESARAAMSTATTYYQNQSTATLEAATPATATFDSFAVAAPKPATVDAPATVANP